MLAQLICHPSVKKEIPALFSVDARLSLHVTHIVIFAAQLGNKLFR